MVRNCAPVVRSFGRSGMIELLCCRPALAQMIGQRQRHTVTQRRFGEFVRGIEQNAAIAAIAQLRIKLAECLDQIGLAVEINRILIGDRSDAVDPDRAAAFGLWREIARLAPFQGFLQRADALGGPCGVEDQATQKKLKPNKSFPDVADTRNLCLPLDAAKAWLQNSSATDTFEFGGVKGCFSTMEIHRNGRPITLTSQEFKTLAYLIKNPLKVISRDELLNEVWGYENYPCTRTVDNHILKLRKKLEPEPARPRHFRTIHGTGYRFVP